jgi:hypothetical protein
LPVPASALAAPVYNPETQEYETPDVPTPLDLYEIHATQQQHRGATERPGLDPSKALYECRVVKSPTGRPLKLPDVMRAGSTFALELVGKAGTAEIVSVPDPQHPTETKKMGQIFFAEWTSYG